MQGKHIAVWFSCGAASAVAAKLSLDKWGKDNKVSVLNNPIKEEDDDNQRFLRDCESWLGIKIESVVNKKYPNQSCVEVWDKRQFMSGPLGAPCTQELKKKARQDWEVGNKPDYTVLGFTSEETKRADRFRLTERDTLLTPLIESNLTKEDCFRIIQQAGIELPRIYKLGYPNANCIGCVKAGSATYWNLVREKHPEVFEQRSSQSREIGSKLVYYQGKRIYLDELPPEAKGRSLKGYDFECGIFCEEKE
jgi:3'-phosphoadenosine 5'-phosphosulfate sulfotransferase (PAPS reductase)/FAD synthetase